MSTAREVLVFCGVDEGMFPDEYLCTFTDYDGRDHHTFVTRGLVTQHSFKSGGKTHFGWGVVCQVTSTAPHGWIGILLPGELLTFNSQIHLSPSQYKELPLHDPRPRERGRTVHPSTVEEQPHSDGASGA